jgi:hypothetical protein
VGAVSGKLLGNRNPRPDGGCHTSSDAPRAPHQVPLEITVSEIDIASLVVNVVRLGVQLLVAVRGRRTGK